MRSLLHHGLAVAFLCTTTQFYNLYVEGAFANPLLPKVALTTTPTTKTTTTQHWMSSASTTTPETTTQSDSNNNDDDDQKPKPYEIVRVDLDGTRDYPIYIGTNFTPEQSSSLLASHIKGSKVLLITNDRLEGLGYLDQYRNLLESCQEKELQVETLVLPDGEEYKTMDVLQRILDKALELRLDRKSTFVALGGGVIGDMVGFASAIYQRGVNFIQIPTTVMAMVDSSVGGKTGVNHPLGKNMVGAFHQPQCVFIDTETLSTLPDRELKSGIAEIIKYGLIRDTEFFQWQEKTMPQLLQRNPETLRYAIQRSCENKAAVVKADELEAGIRATLNLGHTFGHAIENGSGYGTFLHGEAVAIGTAMAARMSKEMGWITEELKERTMEILKRADLPVGLPEGSPMTKEKFLELMSVDKKVADGRLRLILLKGELGGCVITGEFDQGVLERTIEEFVAECRSDA